MLKAVTQTETRVISGELIGITGPIIRARLPGARLLELCELRDRSSNQTMYADVVGIDGDIAFLSAYGSASGLSQRTEIIGMQEFASVDVSEDILGTVIDGMGKLILAKGGGASSADVRRMHLFCAPPLPMERRAINEQLVVGIKAIDGLLSCGKGQRIGIFGNASVGKSSLINQLVKSTSADINVVALIGERGREVKEFIDTVMTGEMRKKTVVIAATSDRPPVERMKAAYVATSIAEYFRDKGKDVLLVMDSITRFARAQREIGLSSGEQPGRRGYPPSVFTVLPQLFERAGSNQHGTITAFYSVLVEGDINNDPIAEETKSLLDGHIILDQNLAVSGHFPAIDILESRSRLMEKVASRAHVQNATRVRKLMSIYKEIELLIRVGEYQSGSEPEADLAIAAKAKIDRFLQQQSGSEFSLVHTLHAMSEIDAS